MNKLMDTSLWIVRRGLPWLAGAVGYKAFELDSQTEQALSILTFLLLASLAEWLMKSHTQKAIQKVQNEPAKQSNA